MNLTAVADEHFDGQDVKNIQPLDENQSKVKIGCLIGLTNHSSAIRFGSPIVRNEVAGRLIKPGIFHLDSNKNPTHIKDQIISQSVSDGSKDPSATLQPLKNGRLLR